MITWTLVRTFAAKHWAKLVVVGVLLAQFAAIAVYKNKAELEAAHAATAQAKHALCEADVVSLETGIAAGNKATQAAAAAGKQVAKEADKRAESVLKSPLPAATGPGADAMNKWLEGVK